MHIVKAKEIHLEAMARLELDNFSQPWSLSSLKDAIIREDTIYLVALEDNQVIGYLGVWQSLDEGELVSIVVSKKNRGLGIAKALMEALVKEALFVKMNQLFLEVRVSNLNAIRFYERFGFEDLGIRKNFYEGPKEDAKIMSLDLIKKGEGVC